MAWVVDTTIMRHVRNNGGRHLHRGPRCGQSSDDYLTRGDMGYQSGCSVLRVQRPQQSPLGTAGDLD